MSEHEFEVWVVDSVGDGIAVLVEAGDEETPSLIEMSADLLGSVAIEGAVLIVPLGEIGEPLWDKAKRDLYIEQALKAEAERMLDRLQERDPGGDIVL
ncbi:MAG: hypothetical protein CME27_01015 [Gemmatimonadetes bacterium]|nr:hypothetical protein [Gemmatimonadota bacterium]|tara:strand:- start:446 stop:739 length:294 start_codon:yes stop_codon:yes gene_type:complete